MVKTKKKDIPLSGYDLSKLFGEMRERSNLVLNNDIKSDWDIEKIFKGSGHAVIFIEYPGEEVGHFTSLTRHHDKKGKGYQQEGQIMYFDSLGEKPTNPAIAEIALKHYPKLLYNEKQYQKDNENSCGRWALAIATLNKLGLSPHQIEDLLDNTKDVNKFIINQFREE